MESVNVTVKKLEDNAKIPTFANKGDVCADLYAVEDAEVLSNVTTAVKTGIAMAIPEGYEAQVRPRSGLALQNEITVLNTPGTIDSGYRGEIKVILRNFGKQSYKVNQGDRIAQIAIRPVPEVSFVEKGELSDTERGSEGFGSTGK